VSGKLERGTVIAAHRRESLVRAEDASLLRCLARGRALRIACGDRVSFSRGPSGEGVIEEIAARTNEFARAAQHRRKVIAANLTQVMIMVACEPTWDDELVCRMLVAAEDAGLPVVLVLNKSDLAELRESSLARLEPFRGLGYPLVEIAARNDAEPLRAYLAGRRTLLAGQSGMGKSTLVGALVPQADVRIREISRYLDAGRQTTTTARLYRLDETSELVDSPGVSEFGLAGFSLQSLAKGFREIAQHATACRFRDCRHLVEPGCAVEEAAGRGAIHSRRLALYRQIARA
jgi:ribosome biogenesis GTPase